MFSENYTPGFQKFELEFHFARLEKKKRAGGADMDDDSQDDFEHLKED